MCGPFPVPPRGTPLIRLRGAGVRYPLPGASVVAFQGVDFCLRAGEHVGLMGPNGAGKSTLLRVLAGEQWLSEGEIFWNVGQGEESSPLAGRAACALVSAARQAEYQRHAFEHGWDVCGEEVLLTARDNTHLLYAAPSADARKAVWELARHWGVTDWLGLPLPALSQGQLRILLLARALLRCTPVLLLDEFTDGMDAPTRRRMPQVLRDVARSATLVVCAHRDEGMPDIVRRRLWMRAGRLGEAAPDALPGAMAGTTPHAVYHAAPRVAAGGAFPNTISPGTISPDTVSPGTPASPPPLVILRHADVYVDRVCVLHQLDWTWRQGEHWRLVGPNGAGKSTFLRLLAGDAHPAAGGGIIRHLPRTAPGRAGEGAPLSLAEIRRGVRLISDAAQACGYDYLDALEAVLTGVDNTAEPQRDFTPAERAAALGQLRLFGMEPWAARPLRTLSTGQVRRVLLARALMGMPDILLLDEPCSGLDAPTRALTLRLLGQAVARGAHLLLVSHHDADALPMCRHILHMREGRVSTEPVRE